MALTKIPGELFDVDDLDLSDVGTIALDAIKGEADTDTSITFSGSNVISVKANNANQITFIFTILSASTVNNVAVSVLDKFQPALPPYILVTETIFGFAIFYFS